MTTILLFAHETAFFEYASYHCAKAGIRLVAAETVDELTEALVQERPSLVLLHWDTLGDVALRSCVLLKQRRDGARTPVAILSEKLAGGVSVISALATGADDLIEGALNPRIFLPRVSALIGRRSVAISVGA